MSAETRRCGHCGLDVRCSEFSAKQLKAKAAKRKCKTCMSKKKLEWGSADAASYDPLDPSTFADWTGSLPWARSGGVRKHYDAASALSSLVEAAHDADAAASHVRLCVDAEGPGAANLIIDCVRLDGKFHCVLSAGTEPVIVVHWSNWQFPRDVQRFVQALQATDDGSQMTQISASAGALAGVVRELEANAAAIAPDFLARRRPPGPHEGEKFPTSKAPIPALGSVFPLTIDGSNVKCH